MRDARGLLLDAAAVAQGLALVTFPAASAVFTDPSGFAFSPSQYGAMFLPQVAMAILAATVAPLLARAVGLKGVLLLGLAADLLSMALLAAGSLVVGSAAAFPLVCVATAALGFGFGATVTALNSLGETLHPERADRAVLTLNALLGVGTAAAPLLVALSASLGAWWALPSALALALAPLVALLSRVPLAAPAPTRGAAGWPARFWLYALAAFLYGILETLAGNWGPLFLTGERGVPAASASLALAAFWIMVTVGRLLAAGVATALPPRVLYVALPVALGAAMLATAAVGGAAAGIVIFAAIGLACSALLPLTLTFAGTALPARATATAGLLLACYQVGYGVAAFGVGPLHGEGVALGTLFCAAAAVAAVLALAAWQIAGRGPQPSLVEAE